VGVGAVRARRKRIAIALAGAGIVAVLGASVVTGAQAAAVEGPLCIPGSATVPVTADAKVSSNHPNQRYGSAGTWKVNFASTARSFVDFDLPAIPTGCSVTEATFRLNGTLYGHPNPAHRWPGAHVNFTLARKGWNERAITWNNMPSSSPCDGGTQDYAQTNSWVITGIVQQAYECVDAGRLSAWNGLKFRGWSPRNRGAKWRLVVDSRESSHPPVVEIGWE
jgi:hypothetical protein